MRLIGIAVSTPICDERTLDPTVSRYSFLSPGLAIERHTYLNGFGPFQVRDRPLISERPSEISYFHCYGAIALPTRLPDGAPVTRWCRRIYLDEFARARLELAAFTNPAKPYPAGDLKVETLARRFWDSPVRVRDNGGHAVQSLGQAVGAEGLPRLFETASQPRDRQSTKKVARLQPQLLVMTEMLEREMPSEAVPVNANGSLKLLVRHHRMAGERGPVPVVQLLHEPGFFLADRRVRLDEHRLVRAVISSYHTDLRLLGHLLGSTDLGTNAVAAAAMEICTNLTTLPASNKPNYTLFVKVVAALNKFGSNYNVRLGRQIDAHPVFDDATKLAVKQLLAIKGEIHHSAAERLAEVAPAAVSANWRQLNDEAFERLVFSLLQTDSSYTNVQLLTKTTANDHGRDISADLMVKTGFGQTRLDRVVVQCKHWQSRSVRPEDLESLRTRIQLLEPPTVNFVIVATSGKFTPDAVGWTEKNNADRANPWFQLWADTHLERLLAARRQIARAFNLLDNVTSDTPSRL